MKKLDILEKKNKKTLHIALIRIARDRLVDQFMDLRLL